MGNNVVIFGASVKGIEALQYYGKDKVVYFCDNDYEKIGTFIEGKEVICIHKLYKIKDEVQIIIASAYENEIIKQLKSKNIFKFEIFGEKNIKKIKGDKNIEKNLEFNKISQIFNLENYEYKDQVKKIKIRFLFQTSIKWKAFESVYKSFIEDEMFDTKIIACTMYGKDDMDILKNNYIKYIPYNEYDIYNDLPHIVFYHEIDELSRPIELNSKKISQIAKVVYIQSTLHNLTLKEEWIKGQIQTPIFDNAWKIILGDKDYYQMTIKNSNNNENKVLLTNPRWDNIFYSLNSKIEYSSEWIKKTQGRKVFLWNPHFYILGQNSSTFDIYLKYILQFFLEKKEYSLIIRPHPYLFRSLEENGIWNSEQIDKFKQYITSSSNIILDDNIDYVKAFSISGALMSDLSTFLLAYLPTNKPILYLHHPKCEKVYDVESLKSYYFADKLEDVSKFIEIVSNNRDYLYDNRLELINRKIGILDGKAGERIKNYVIDEYYKQNNIS